MTGLGIKLFRSRKPTPPKEEIKRVKQNQPVFPTEISANIQEAYNQALYLVERSPRASGALSRYCLQNIIRDFWNIGDENYATVASDLLQIQDQIAEETRQSINCVRQYGSIDSHFGKHRDLMVSTTKDEAKMLIALVQLLMQDWHLERERRRSRYKSISRMAQNLCTKHQTLPCAHRAEVPDACVAEDNLDDIEPTIENTENTKIDTENQNSLAKLDDLKSEQSGNRALDVTTGGKPE